MVQRYVKGRGDQLKFVGMYPFLDLLIMLENDTLCFGQKHSDQFSVDKGAFT